MSPGIINFTNNVKVEWVNVIVKSLVIEEELGEEAEILAVQLMLLSVDFVYTQTNFSVDFSSRWMSFRALCYMLPERLLLPHILETKLADIESFGFGVFVRIRRKIPTLHFPSSHKNLLNILHFCGFFMFLFQGGKGRITSPSSPIAP
jgi:hypothetical protein